MLDKWAMGIVIEYDDDGPSDSQVLHVGTKAECEEVLDATRSVTADPLRPCMGAYAAVVPVKALEEESANAN
jgi:hypothetical protein